VERVKKRERFEIGEIKFLRRAQTAGSPGGGGSINRQSIGLTIKRLIQRLGLLGGGGRGKCCGVAEKGKARVRWAGCWGA